jgi:hypothetical protein
MEADVGRLGFELIGFGGGYVVERKPAWLLVRSEAQCGLPISDDPFRHQQRVVPCTPMFACDVPLPFELLRRP